MAVEFKDKPKRGSIYYFFPEELKWNPKYNGRVDIPKIDALVASIIKFGQDTPIGIRAEGPSSARVPIVEFGFSRLRAFLKINKEKMTPELLRIACVYVEGNEQDGFLANIRENFHRNQTTAVDDAANIKHMRGWNMSDEQIAQVYFPESQSGDLKRAVAWVKKRAKLSSLTPEAQEAVKSGRVKPSAAEHLAELAEEAQKDIVQRDGKISKSDIAAASGVVPKPSFSQLKKTIATAANDLMTPTGKRISQDVADWLISICE